MTAQTKTLIKTYFESGDKPTAGNFADFIDSCAFLAETSAQNFVGNVSVSGNFNVYGTATFANVSAGTLNAPILNSPTINTPTVSAGSFLAPNISNATVSAATINASTINSPTVNSGTFSSPILTGVPVAPTAASATSTTQIATTAFVQQEIAASAWSSYTPSVTSTGGGFGSASATGKFRRVGKTMQYQANITIATAGGASGVIIFSLPASAAARSVGVGMETDVTGSMVKALIQADSAVGQITSYDNSSIIGSGRVVLINGAYETT